MGGSYFLVALGGPCPVNGQLETVDMFPDLLPEIVVRIWKAHDRHYATGTRTPPTRAQIERYLKDDETYGPSSLSEIDRARKRYPKLLPWPILRGQRRPWEAKPDLLDDLVDYHSGGDLRLVGDEPPLRRALLRGVNGEVIEAMADASGRVIQLVLRDTTASVAAAALFVFGVLDQLSDGRLDGVVHWCHFLVKSGSLRL